MNKFASVILFDVGCRKLSTSQESFFARSKRCLSRLILRKMFSGDCDELGIILFGSDVTDNCMPEREREKYSNIRELCGFQKANFSMLDRVESISQCKGFISDWVLGAIVALEFLSKSIQGKRYKSRQIVIFSEFPTVLDYESTILITISNCLKDLNINLVVVGPEMDLESDGISQNLKLLVRLFELVEDPLSLNINELTDSLKYFEKKRKVKRVSNIDLEIGSKIKIPVGWVKLTEEFQRFSSWVDKKVLALHDEEGNSGNPSGSETVKFKDETMECESEPSMFSKRYTKDTVKVTKFGATEINFGEADLTAMKRVSGAPSFKILMFTSKSQVNPSMYVGNNIYAVVPREKSVYSRVQFYALIDVLKERNKVAIARRITTNNGIIQLGVLIPFRDECGKHLYFLRIPTAEWTQPFPRHRACPSVAQGLKDKFKTLIDTMRLPQNLIEGSDGVLVTNPHFQLRCQLLANRAMDPTGDISIVPQYIQEVIDPRPEYRDSIRDVTKDIILSLPSLNSLVRKENTENRILAKATKSAERRVNNSLTSNDTYIKVETSNFQDNTDVGFGSITIVDETSVAIHGVPDTLEDIVVKEENFTNEYQCDKNLGMVGTSTSAGSSVEGETSFGLNVEVELEHEDLSEFDHLLQHLD